MMNDHLVMVMMPVSTVMTVSIMMSIPIVMPVSVMILPLITVVSTVIESPIVKPSAIAVKCTGHTRIQPQQGGHQAGQA